VRKGRLVDKRTPTLARWERCADWRTEGARGEIMRGVVEGAPSQSQTDFGRPTSAGCLRS